MQPIVSIITPCFNADKYLRETLDCLQKQTINKWECIIVNDGSTDQSSAIAHEYAAKDSRYVVIDKENEGPSVARNVGIKASHGKYILPLDADDIIDKTYIEKSVNYLESHGDVKLVYCLAEYFGDIRGEWNLPEYDYKSLLWNNMVFCTAMFRRSDYDKTKGYNTNMVYGNEDWDLWLSLLGENDKVYRIPEVLFFYRKHGNSVTDVAISKSYQSHSLLIKNHMEIYEPFLADMFEYRIAQYNYDLIQKRVVYLENEIKEIFASKSYRLGKILLWPFHKLIQMLT